LMGNSLPFWFVIDQVERVQAGVNPTARGVGVTFVGNFIRQQ